MDVIPVIDVRHGLAVAAVRGQRADYKPLVTPLAAGSDPADIARGYAALFTFPLLYVADLDGIEGGGATPTWQGELAARGSQYAALDRRRHAGAQMPPGASPEERNATLVIGSESLGGLDDVAALRALPPDRYVLSLDFKGDRFEARRQVLDEAQHWPEAVIVMTLARVGSGEGPDLARIARDRCPRRRPPRLCCRRRAQSRRYRSAACGRRGRRAHRHCIACRNDKGRRPQGDRRPFMS